MTLIWPAVQAMPKLPSRGKRHRGTWRRPAYSQVPRALQLLAVASQVAVPACRASVDPVLAAFVLAVMFTLTQEHTKKRRNASGGAQVSVCCVLM